MLLTSKPGDLCENVCKADIVEYQPHPIQMLILNKGFVINSPIIKQSFPRI
jgi:hypothetical protein